MGSVVTVFLGREERGKEEKYPVFTLESQIHLQFKSIKGEMGHNLRLSKRRDWAGSVLESGNKVKPV